MTVLYWAAYAVCLLISAGGVVFYGLVLIAARRFEREGEPDAPGFTPPITVLKPLAGLERDLESNLRTFFEQDYPEYQILFAVREADDPAIGVARRLLAEYPERDAEVIVSGEPQFPNAKVQSLLCMAERARYDILLISDSDIRATPGHLRAIAADFADPRVGVSCCPYVAVPGPVDVAATPGAAATAMPNSVPASVPNIQERATPGSEAAAVRRDVAATAPDLPADSMARPATYAGSGSVKSESIAGESAASSVPPARPGFWSLLEALTLNTEFWCGVLVARMLEGVQFAIGPTMALRRQYLDRVGGFAAVGEYLAEDFVLGQWAEKHGYKAVLSRHVVEHHIGGQPFRANWKHRVRWARSTRRSRPWGYLGQVFTNPLPFALPLIAGPAALLAALVFVARVAVIASVAGRLLRDPLVRRAWWLVPLADVASLVNWVLGFFGSQVEWRGRRYQLFPDGRFRRAV